MVNKIPQLQRKDFLKFVKDLKAFSANFSCKKPLFLTAVHGDERIGVEAMSEVVNQFNVDWLVGNEKAIDKGLRFVECDLNRSGPGKEKSKKYEEQRAYKIINKFKKYDAIIDLHGSKSKTGIFIILTKPSIADLQLALQFDIRNIVIWLPSTKRKSGPLVQFANRGIEIESGPKNHLKTKNDLIDIIKKFLGKQKHYTLDKRNIFWVYGKQLESVKGLKNFQLFKGKKEQFYPLLVNEYDFPCYKMIKLN